SFQPLSNGQSYRREVRAEKGPEQPGRRRRVGIGRHGKQDARAHHACPPLPGICCSRCGRNSAATSRFLTSLPVQGRNSSSSWPGQVYEEELAGRRPPTARYRYRVGYPASSIMEPDGVVAANISPVTEAAASFDTA